MPGCEDWVRGNVMMWAGGSTRVGPCGRRVMGYCEKVYADYLDPAATAAPQAPPSVLFLDRSGVCRE